VSENEVAFMHTLTKIPRYLTLTKDIMWLYGLSAAEGSKRGLTLNINESNLANKADKIYTDFTKLNKANIILNEEKNSQQVLFTESKTYRTIFFETMEIGYGACNKSIKFLYNLDKELIRSALKGLFDGDGTYRKRLDKRNNKYYFNLSYKTCSEQLANELVHILSTIFNIKASIYKGVNKKRKIENRILSESVYYMVDIYGVENINQLFPGIFKNDEDFINIGNRKFSNKKIDKYIKIQNIIPLGDGVVYDIILENNSSHLFTVSHGVITHNCGGGEPTEHPDFFKILKAFDDLGIQPNYTTNGMWVEKDIMYISDMMDYTINFCGGVAVSCHPHLKKYWEGAANYYVDWGVKLNFHLIISDKESIDDFIQIYNKWESKVDYFVLLPYGTQGRAEQKDIDWDYLVEKLPTDHSKIAFGANFYSYLKQGNHDIKVSLYEPEIMSKYISLEGNGLMYNSSFSDEIIKRNLWSVLD
jgi:hypothetical protein